MIIDPPITELLEKSDCRYTLIVEVSKRRAGNQPGRDHLPPGG